jgi:3-methyladenine DNA glycosylase AlkC
LHELTRRFSAEGDLRTFLEINPEKTLKILHEWTKDKSPHVRRLVSEGTRPRLPMSARIKRFQENPRPVLKLLEKLKDDPELYVRRSVANNVNDIAKDNPELAIETLKRWRKSKSAEVDWIIKHASRSLVKAGNTAALELQGVSTAAQLKLKDLQIKPARIDRGTGADLSFEIRNLENRRTPVILDYVIHFKKASGKLLPKVFKLRRLAIQPGQSCRITKIHRFKDTSGRKHYPGKHLLQIQANGNIIGEITFSLI